MTSTARTWTGRIASTLPVLMLMLMLSAGMKLLHSTQVVAMFSGLGYPDGLLTALAVLELGCTVLYVVPRTSVLGAVLLTGYLGGAISAHVRVGDPFVVPLVLGLLVWGGLYLRDARLRALLRLRTPEPVPRAQIVAASRPRSPGIPLAPGKAASVPRVWRAS